MKGCSKPWANNSCFKIKSVIIKNKNKRKSLLWKHKHYNRRKAVGEKSKINIKIPEQIRSQTISILWMRDQKLRLQSLTSGRYLVICLRKPRISKAKINRSHRVNRKLHCPRPLRWISQRWWSQNFLKKELHTMTIWTSSQIREWPNPKMKKARLRNRTRTNQRMWWTTRTVFRSISKRRAWFRYRSMESAKVQNSQNQTASNL